jgi:hypothetical protein
MSIRKAAAAALAGILAGILAMTSLAPGVAYADPRGRQGHYRDHRDHDDDDALAAGVVGLVLGTALGAAISDGRRRDDRSYRDGYYGDRYYRDGYYRDGYYRDRRRSAVCIRRERRYDPYYGRDVIVETRHRC